jgi:RNA polymerase sigma-70 factor (ECF subfamily)
MTSCSPDRLIVMTMSLREHGLASDDVTTSTKAPDAALFEQYRRELTAYCYRMLGSGFDADDAVQETLVRAWRSVDSFEGRSSTRSWLYRIATNVCIDALRGRNRRARPMEIGPSRPPVEASLEYVLSDGTWIDPIADERVLPMHADPAELVEARDSVRLAFVAALQRLPARQRAALILAEVLHWQASEVAELLGTTVAAINSALQRARATLAEAPVTPSESLDATKRALLDRYCAAFERYDVDALVALLHEDAIQTMPPFAMWLRGRADIGTWMLGPGHGCRGSRLIATAANGTAAFAQYRADPQGGHLPWALQVLELADDKIVGIHSFLDASRLFASFGLPAHLPA